MPVDERVHPGCRPVADPQRSRVAGQPLDQLGEPSGQVNLARSHVVVRERAAEHAPVALGHGDAQQQPVQTRGPRVGPDLVEGPGPAVRARRGPTARPVSATHCCSVDRSSWSKWKRRATGGARRQVEHLGGRHPGAGEVEEAGGDAEQRVGLTHGAVGQPDPEAGQAVPDGPDRGSVMPRSGDSTGSSGPKAAWIKGANVSMSGHMTMTSRGSRVSSAASKWSTASRATSTWRARP